MNARIKIACKGEEYKQVVYGIYLQLSDKRERYSLANEHQVPSPGKPPQARYCPGVIFINCRNCLEKV